MNQPITNEQKVELFDLFMPNVIQVVRDIFKDKGITPNDISDYEIAQEVFYRCQDTDTIEEVADDLEDEMNGERMDD